LEAGHDGRREREVARGAKAMEFFRIERTIPFMKYSLILNGISVVTFLVALGFLFFRGLNLSVEFTGGTLMEVRYSQAADLEKIRGAVEGKGWGEFQVQNFGTSRDVLIRLPLQPGYSSGQQADKVMATLKAQDASAELQRVEFVGPAVGAELAHDGAVALIIVVVGIMIYLAFRFEWKFSVAAIIANMHDVILVVGLFAIFGWEFSLPVLAAILAVLGYSVNESVIIFDRVREHFKRYRKMSTVEAIDSAITATISRTMITHGSTLCMTLAMLIFGGPALHYFALALTIGIVFGIYSSVFVAAAIAMWLGVKREDLIKPVKKKDGAEVELP
jgi:preprotein translocase subunit SecF